MSERVDSETTRTGDWLAGGGEMGDLIRETDWARTPLGPLERWSPSLKMMVRFLLANRFPMLLWWGPHFIQIYNDPYRPILGTKHPTPGLGRSVSECWSEIWHILRPLIQTPFDGGPATWMEDILLEINRYGFTEESHFTIAYSPVPDDSVPNGIGGVLATVHEITEKVVGERRVVVLRDLGARGVEAKTAQEACAAAAATLARHPTDVPFALLYLIDADGRRARLAGVAGAEAGSPIAPDIVDLEDPSAGSAAWPLASAVRNDALETVDDLTDRFGDAVPAGPWSDPPCQAVVTPIRSNIAHQVAGVLVAGASSRLRLDESYRGFMELAASQIATAVANARAYEEERRRAEALAELDRAKTAFFSNVSHEFRTPLTLMLGPIEDALAGTDLTPETREQLELAHRNSQRLLKLVNTMLDFSRIEAGRIDAVFEPLDLGPFVADLASLFRSAVERAGLRLAIDCPPLTEPVFVDRAMAEKIVLNLLSNAFKFTFDGEIAITVRRVDGEAELKVRDTGTGIPAEEVPHLFERFHRVKGARGRSFEGSGIGLALVQELVRLHGGTVEVRSEVDHGSEFTVRIPFGAAHLPADRVGAAHSLVSTGARTQTYVEEISRWLPEVGDAPLPLLSEPTPATSRLRPQGGATPARVLVADDNADMREYVSRLLGATYDVIAVADGEAALAALDEQTFDLVLADVMMPRLDGLGLLAALRRDKRTRAIPVILLSARAGEEARVEGLEAAADDYQTKPFSARELLARVEAHLRLAQLRRQEDERFRAFVTASADVVYRMSPDWSEMRQLQGREFIADTDEPSGDWLQTYIYPDDQARVVAAIAEAIRTRGKFELEHRVVRVDGTIGWTASRAIPILDANGEITEWLGTASDVTRRKEAEERLSDSEAKNRAVLSSMDEGLMLADVLFDESGERAIDYLVLETNDAFYKHTGLPRGIVGMTIREILGTDDVPWLGIYGEVAVSGQPIRFEHEITIDLLAGWHDVFIQRIGEPEQRRVAVMFQNITERKRTEANLALVAALSEQLLALSTSAEIIRAFGQLLGATIGATACAFNEKCERAGEVAIVDEWHRTPGISLVGRYDISEYIGGELERAMEAGTPFVMRDVERDPRVRDTDKFAALGIGAFAMLPLIRDGEWRFALGVYHDRAYAWRDDEIALLVDATNRIWNKLERLRAEEALREADRAKDEFLAMLAHELRNPLAPIRSAAEILKLASPTDASQWRATEVIERQTRHLARLVDDLLDVSRITRGKVALQLETVDLATVVNRAIETSRPLVDSRGHRLTLDVSGEPLHVEGDATRLVQIVSNLLNNAAKYTDEGGRITIEAAREGREAVLRVRDNGIGISADLLPRVFDLFSQADRSLDRSEGGLGIGLTLARQLAELHGGRMEARSEGEGRGSEFVLRLPLLGERHEAPDAGAPGRDETVGRQPLRILVVEDNVDSADMMAILLRIDGHEVRLAHDGPEAIEAASAFAPEVVVCDIGLPGMDGYEVVQQLRARLDLERTHFVALSGYGDPAAKLRAIDAGFDHHLVKPVEPRVLASLLVALGASGARTKGTETDAEE